jgi:hypothetical protein
VKTRFEIGTKDWIKNSVMLTELLKQKRLLEYMGRR